VSHGDQLPVAVSAGYGGQDRGAFLVTVRGPGSHHGTKLLHGPGIGVLSLGCLPDSNGAGGENDGQCNGLKKVIHIIQSEIKRPIRRSENRGKIGQTTQHKINPVNLSFLPGILAC